MKKLLLLLGLLSVTSMAMAQDSIWVYLHNGQNISCLISQVDSISFVAPQKPIVTDVDGNVYPVVKIGCQYWMAENLRATKYDTQSERAGAVLSTSSSKTYDPYYTDGRQAVTDYSGNLTSAQRNKLGLLYNWAAAMGYASESEATAQTGAYSGNRQGICPNGWHLPSRAEWDTLYNYIYNAQSLSSNKVGKYLKSTSGWYNAIGNGTDTYGFNVLPAGTATGSSVSNVGLWTYFWTSAAYYSSSAFYRGLGCSYDYLDDGYSSKGNAHSVRCVRD